MTAIKLYRLAFVGALVLACIGVGVVRGKLTGHEIAHDTPSLIAYIAAAVLATLGPVWAIGRRR